MDIRTMITNAVYRGIARSVALCAGLMIFYSANEWLGHTVYGF